MESINKEIWRQPECTVFSGGQLSCDMTEELARKHVFVVETETKLLNITLLNIVLRATTLAIAQVTP